jgi:hypothetical protein
VYKCTLPIHHCRLVYICADSPGRHMIDELICNRYGLAAEAGINNKASIKRAWPTNGLCYHRYAAEDSPDRSNHVK